MKVYVGGPFDKRDMVSKEIEKIKESGFEITHDWTIKEDENAWEKPRKELSEIAMEDIEGVMEADALICLFDHSVNMRGTYTEIGVALNQMKPVILVNCPHKYIFRFYPGILEVNCLEAAIYVLKSLDLVKSEIWELD